MMPIHKASRSGVFGIVLLLGVSILYSSALFAQHDIRRVEPADISAVMRTLEGPMAAEPPVVYQKDGGFIHFLGAPPMARFVGPVDPSKSGYNPETAAFSFLEAYDAAFGLDLPEMELRTRRIREQSNKTYVSMDQYYKDLMVFGAQVVVQVNDDMTIRNIMCDVMRDPGALLQRTDALAPVLTADQAEAEARRQNAALSENEYPEEYDVPEPPQLRIFHPGIMDMPGDTRLAWKVPLVYSDPFPTGMVVLIDAHTGELLMRYADNGIVQMTKKEIAELFPHAFTPGPKAAGAPNRRVYDAANNANLALARLVRSEGDSPTGNMDVDRLYDYLGDCYDYYWQRHGRDSFDDNGGNIIAYANYPFMNAMWVMRMGAYADIMVIGTGFVADDIIAHEFTHGVTDYESDMIYFSFSGAINEMYSDKGGEFVDLTNGRGTDTPEVRWFIGEDLTVKAPDMRGRETEEIELVDSDLPGIRYMKNPTVFGHPDRLGSPFLADPFSQYDLGGVHINNGIGNKLIYLLTDGDEFNGQTVKGMGIDKVGALFYEARPMLGRMPTYYDLYFALGAASVDLGFSMDERLNIIAGARAVEIEPPEITLLGLRDFRATPTEDNDNNPVIVLTWSNPPADAYSQLTLYRSVVGYPTGPGTGTLIPLAKTDNAYLDRNVRHGVEYFYTLIADVGGNFPQTVSAKATAGAPQPDILTEVFGYDPDLGVQDPYDLSYSQITIRPVGEPPDSLGAPLLDMGYDAYEATITKPVYELPVKRRDAYGAAHTLIFTDDGLLTFNMGDRVIPFFGRKYNRLVVGANGYVGFDEFWYVGSQALFYLNFPSLVGHFVLPRISFLFADLAPTAGGEIWARILPDRLVITFEKVPVWPTAAMLTPRRNTVQLELFDSGHIRITYLETWVDTGIVGLSDGRGVPRDPVLEFDDLKPVYQLSDFSSMPRAPRRLSIEPIATQHVATSGVVEFMASALTPPGMAGVPEFSAEWDGPGMPPFTDQGDGTGRFFWPTRPADTGIYLVRVKASLGEQRTFQDVRIIVGASFARPEARDLQLSTGSPYEDPRVNRTTSSGVPLIASYAYYHPYLSQSPLTYAEGPSLIYWFRNGQLATAFTDSIAIPSHIPQPGDQWWFQVTPITISYIWGNPATSPVVTILDVPEIHTIEPNRGLTIGGDTVVIRGRNLSNPLAVYFSDVRASNVRSFSDGELSVRTPIHPAGTVTVSVETSGGIGRRVDGFTFVDDGNDEEPDDDDKQRRILGCAPGNGHSGPIGLDLLFLFVVAGVVISARRRHAGSEA